MAEFPGVLVTDFDGTITRHDFYKLVVKHLLTPADLSPWKEYLAGTITHFEAIRTIFLRIRQPEARMRELTRETLADPRLPECVAALRSAGWDVVVASAGCDWYVRRILADLGVDVTVHANPGEYPAGGPLIMRAAPDSPFYRPDTGVDKAAIVRFHLGRGKTVAYAGDGYADEEAALLVPEGLRFAKADLAEALTRHGAAFRPFAVWSEVADALLAESLVDGRNAR